MERLSMRKIREVLRLRFEAGRSARQIGASVQVARSTIGEYERRFAASGLPWPLPESLSDAELERRLFPPAPALPAHSRPIPDWASLHQELRRPGVSLMLLWEEYRAAYPQGYGYSWFCDTYASWSAKLDVVMRRKRSANYIYPARPGRRTMVQWNATTHQRNARNSQPPAVTRRWSSRHHRLPDTAGSVIEAKRAGAGRSSGRRLNGSSASIACGVFARGSCSKRWLRYARGSSLFALAVSMRL
ncbi:Transposase [Thiorhodovibrio litoralis]|nr:Transposase [Thiorhodovibrio litoralis]